MAETEFLSQRAFASLPEVSVSHVRINTLIKEGRIPVENGKIPKQAGLKAWATCRQVGYEKSAVAGKKFGGDPKKTKNTTGVRQSLDEDDDVPQSSEWGERFNRAKTLEKEQMAIKRKFENEVEQGRYVLKSDVKHEASTLASAVKQKLISIAPIIAVTAEGKTALQIQKIVEKHINEALGMLQEVDH